MAEDPREQSRTDTTASTEYSKGTEALDMRRTVGTGMDNFTKIVNGNLIAARYGIFAGVTLLTVYGLSQTPLFFRYRTVADLPASHFIARRRLKGRIIGVDMVESASGGTRDIRILVRHLSPMGQILPKSWFDFLVKFTPRASLTASAATGKPEESARDLLKIKLAGIHPPPVSRLVYLTEEQLKRLASERTLVSCQLLARQVVSSQPLHIADGSNTRKRPIQNILPELASGDVAKMTELQQGSSQIPEVAICRVTYRPTLFQLFPTDLAQSLIASGNSGVSSTIFGHDESDGHSSTIKDASQRLQDLENDVKYLNRLAKVEFEAAAKSNGMWSVPEVRAAKREVIDEVEFQAKASAIAKLWRWIRGG